jgi:hypothetical protein
MENLPNSGETSEKLFNELVEEQMRLHPEIYLNNKGEQ